MDASPVYSRDGQLIAFHRRVFSSAGPPGLYVVPSSGGAIRYIAPGDFWWPDFMQFSPDGKQVVYVVGLQIYIADIPTATYWNLFYTQNLASYPDWSPDGRYIVHSRGYDSALPIDSAGIHVFDLATRTDRQIRPEHVPPSGYNAYFGRYPLWSPDGKQVAFIEGTGKISLINADGADYRILATSPPHV